MNTKGTKFIAIYEIIGGLLGVVIVSMLLYKLFKAYAQFDQGVFLSTLLTCIIVLSLYIISLIAGFLLWKGQNLGNKLSLFIQALQIPNISLSGFSYIFVSGIQLALNISKGLSEDIKFNLFFYLGSKFDINLFSKESSFLIGVNIIALLIFIYLKKINKNTA